MVLSKDIAPKPLVILHTTAVSLNEYYTNTDWDSTNITITHLNTQQITNTNFTTPYWPYRHQGTIRSYFYKDTNPDHHNNNIMEQTIGNLVPLTLTKQWTNGSSYNEAKLQSYETSFSSYKTNFSKYCGNPFTYHNLQEQPYYTSTTDPVTLFTTGVFSNNENTKLKDITITGHDKPTWTKFQEPVILKSRYNPLKDDGKSTRMYLVSNNKDNVTWDPPTNQDLQLEGFPLWINIWGFTDFQKRLEKLQNIENQYILTFINTTTDPKRNFPFVVLDQDFLSDKSPYSPTVHPDDQKKWYPQLQYQHQQINNIAQCGLGTPKLPKATSDQVTVKYDFKFKWGGAPAQMVTVDNPTQQAVYPVPSNEHETTPLQGPTQAFESVLYTFDERNNQLTKQAFDRIKKDWGLTDSLFKITETTREEPVQTLQTPQQQAQTQEEKEAALLQQLELHKQQQMELRLRIFQLMQTMQM